MFCTMATLESLLIKRLGGQIAFFPTPDLWRLSHLIFHADFNESRTFGEFSISALNPHYWSLPKIILHACSHKSQINHNKYVILCISHVIHLTFIIVPPSNGCYKIANGTE